MQPNLFPAILIAGPPNCGKSVLSYSLTEHLRKMNISHYLLRAAPDGEGNFVFDGLPGIVRALRQGHKRPYSPVFVSHTRRMIETRLLPLLVDVGGKPQGEDQFAILRACTHSIILYRTQDELQEWRNNLSGTHLQSIAELRSSLTDPDQYEEKDQGISGVINGLHRDKEIRQLGSTFAAVVKRVAGICSYESAYLESVHLSHAPLPCQLERDLALQINPDRQDAYGPGAAPRWSPANLTRLDQIVEAGQPQALYGRGPVWLAAMLAVHALPAPYALYDARYGWVSVPEVIDCKRSSVRVFMSTAPEIRADWVSFKMKWGVIEPGSLRIRHLEGENGVVLSGKMPRWFFAALARKLAPGRAWVGVDDPNLGKVVVVHSRAPEVLVGMTMPRAVSS